MYVLNEGPWAFDGNILLLHDITGLEQPSEVKFTKARFWIKAYDVPALNQTSSFARFFGSKVGEFVGCDEANLCGVDKSLNFQAEVDIGKALRRGIKVMLDKKPIWITFKYLKLPDFCYVCGRLGHVFKACELYGERMDENDFQYGLGMRASPMKLRRRNAEQELQEERRLVMAFRKNKNKGKFIKALTFGKVVNLEAGRPEGAAKHVNMLIDKNEVVVPGNEATENASSRRKPHAREGTRCVQ